MLEVVEVDELLEPDEELLELEEEAARTTGLQNAGMQLPLEA